MNDSDIPARLEEALAAGDMVGFADLFAPGATVWHSVTRKEVTVAESAAMIETIRSAAPDLRYEDVRVRPTPDGFVRQHNLCGTMGDEKPFSFPACIVATTSGGRIESLEEYIDSTAARRLLTPPAAQ